MPENETMFKAKDVRLLREKLAWLHKRTPPQLQQQIDMTLREFAKNISEYCKHDEKVFIPSENSSACLSCGKRFNAK